MVLEQDRLSFKASSSHRMFCPNDRVDQAATSQRIHFQTRLRLWSNAGYASFTQVPVGEIADDLGDRVQVVRILLWSKPAAEEVPPWPTASS